MHWQYGSAAPSPFSVFFAPLSLSPPRSATTSACDSTTPPSIAQRRQRSTRRARVRACEVPFIPLRGAGGRRTNRVTRAGTRSGAHRAATGAQRLIRASRSIVDICVPTSKMVHFCHRESVNHKQTSYVHSVASWLALSKAAALARSSETFLLTAPRSSVPASAIWANRWPISTSLAAGVPAVGLFATPPIRP